MRARKEHCTRADSLMGSGNVEFCALICPQTTGVAVREQFLKRLYNFLTSLGFQWHGPAILAVYIDYCQEIFVALVRSGKR